ncbi:hypothetical protein GPECTOR_2g1550 [Gonium pectorale]|uniref:Ubiquitin conjugation factor E4 core domain-containing protein n=1 Tax=Gonium pectorale TaxID=33097 RepID=A0A150H2E1_GONPE|nr:hypothetical protein GPECTOR_2g1550 [Gonium pectorale]|eukprot:KXZ55998.1 hypothetical protein GPECTOR_2g1550 [Gonium pectorale]
MDPPAQDGDFMDDDMELQLALALSLQETTAADLGAATPAAAGAPAQGPGAAPPNPAGAGGAPNFGDLAALLSQGLQAAAAPPPPAPAAAVPPPATAPQQAAAPAAGGGGGGGQDFLASLLQQFLAAQAMPGGAAGAPHHHGAAPPAAAATTAGTGGGRAATARSALQPTAVPLPGWAAKLRSWHSSGRAPEAFHAASVTLDGPEQVAAVAAFLGEALQVKAVTDSAALGAGGALFLKTSTAAGGGRELSADSVRSLVSSALLQRRVAPRERLQALHRAHDALPAAASLPGGGAGGVAAALDLVVGVLCREAWGLLRDDGADLYSDTGANTAAFADALAGGVSGMCEPFLEGLLDAAGERGAAVWARLARECACSTDLLLADVEAAARVRPPQAARQLESGCVLAPLLGASPYPSGQDALNFKVVSPARSTFLETRGYPKIASAGTSCRTVLQSMMARVQDGAGHLMLRLSRVKDGGLAREALLSWVAAVGRSNLVRLAFGETAEMRTQQDVGDFLAGGSDGFLLNVTGGCLRLAQPFVAGWLDLYRSGHDPVAAATSGAPAPAAGPRWSDLFDKHLRPDYYRTQRHRLGDLSQVFNATGSRGAGGFSLDDDAPSTAPPLLAQARAGLDWVAWLVRGGAGPPAASLSLVPEYAAGDALDWLTHVLYAGRADLVAAKPIAVIMRAVVSLLNANDVVRGAMLQNKIVNLLLAMLASQIHNVQSREARGLALAPDRMSTGERALVGAVLGAPVTQRQLVPALLRAHVNADLVVGLDVDKDAYDKYGMRHHIDKILDELIKDAVLKRCLTDLAAANEPAAGAGAGPGAAASSGVEAGLFSDYASGIVNTVMHYFKDGLDRLADIYAIERSKADAAAWAALPAEERQRKEDFYRGQQRAASGFLSMGVANLKWLITLTGPSEL